jgi:DnaJ-class molecular chaperone
MKKIVAIVVTAVFAISMTGCFLHKKTVVSEKRVQTTTERSAILSDEAKPLKDWVKCRTCDGKGTCSNCNGKGKINNRTCAACSGTGKCNICAGEGGYRSE